MSIIKSSWRFALVLAVASCDSPSKTTPDAPPPLRPGVEDSSQGFKGTPNEHESAFWAAVLAADDAGRTTVVAQLKADVASDPSNGYSDFLIGASYFMPPRPVLAALANGTQPPDFQTSPDAMPFFKDGLQHLTDPFYLGFDGALLAGLQFQSGDIAGGTATFTTAVGNNHVASGFSSVIGDLAMQDPARALADVYDLLAYCNGAPLSQTGSDAAGYVVKLDAGTLRQRECYSGPFAPHASSGLLLVIGDLHALNGDPPAAHAYYAAARTTSDYASWPLKPVVERRLASGAPAPSFPEVAAITGTCGTCHVQALP